MYPTCQNISWFKTPNTDAMPLPLHFMQLQQESLSEVSDSSSRKMWTLEMSSGLSVQEGDVGTNNGSNRVRKIQLDLCLAYDLSYFHSVVSRGCATCRINKQWKQIGVTRIDMGKTIRSNTIPASTRHHKKHPFLQPSLRWVVLICLFLFLCLSRTVCFFAGRNRLGHLGIVTRDISWGSFDIFRTETSWHNTVMMNLAFRKT